MGYVLEHITRYPQLLSPSLTCMKNWNTTLKSFQPERNHQFLFKRSLERLCFLSFDQKVTQSYFWSNLYSDGQKLIYLSFQCESTLKYFYYQSLSCAHPTPLSFSKESKTIPVDTGRKLNVHKTFRRRPGRLLNVLCTFNLRPASTGMEVWWKCMRLR